jgi:hypothetical protein
MDGLSIISLCSGFFIGIFFSMQFMTTNAKIQSGKSFEIINSVYKCEYMDEKEN